jgi:hypothetical protein
VEFEICTDKAALLTASSQEQADGNFFKAEQFAEAVEDKSLVGLVEQIRPVHK